MGSVLSRSTGTVPNTWMGEPALLRKRPAALITKATSMKSEPRLPDTSLHSMPRSVNGIPKSQIGNQLPKPVSKKRSPVCFHGATAEPNQLKPKSKLSDKSSEPKLKPGSNHCSCNQNHRQHRQLEGQSHRVHQQGQRTI